MRALSYLNVHSCLQSRDREPPARQFEMTESTNTRHRNGSFRIDGVHPEVNKPAAAGPGNGKKGPGATLSRSHTDRVRVLADQFVAPGSVGFSKQIPLLLTGFGILTAAVSAIANPTWIPFGPMASLGGILTWVVLGDDQGSGPLKERFLRWLRVWPIWEYLFLLVVVAWVVGLAVLHEAWISMVMGLVTGIAVVSIYYLTVVFALRRERAEIEQSYRATVAELADAGTDPQAIRGDIPVALGENWIPLYEREYGHEAYRKAAERLIVGQPELLERRPRWHDFFCEFLGDCIRYRRGPVRAIMSLPRCYRFMVERRDVIDYVARLSEAESHATDTLKSQMEVADAWWSVSENARTIAYQRAAKRRAVNVYERLYDAIPDPMERLHVKTRIDVVIDGDEEVDVDAVTFHRKLEPKRQAR